jgi:hypothetical protein
VCRITSQNIKRGNDHMITQQNLTRNKFVQMAAAFTTGLLLSSGSAHAAGANDFSSIATNINTSISSIPGLLTAMAYLFGILIGVLGILKIKDHVENPSNTPLKDGAIRLAAGGALFALPIMYQAMMATIGSGTAVSAAMLHKTSMALN